MFMGIPSSDSVGLGLVLRFRTGLDRPLDIRGSLAQTSIHHLSLCLKILRYLFMIFLKVLPCPSYLPGSARSLVTRNCPWLITLVLHVYLFLNLCMLAQGRTRKSRERWIVRSFLRCQLQSWWGTEKSCRCTEIRQSESEPAYFFVNIINLQLAALRVIATNLRWIRI
jgi:hypothetical protein